MCSDRSCGNSQKSENEHNAKHVFSIATDIILGLLLRVLCLLFVGVAYVLVFGYGLGTMLHYAFAETLLMPVSVDFCFKIGLMPVVNVVLGLFATWVLMWKLIILGIWKILPSILWLVSIWLENIVKHI